MTINDIVTIKIKRGFEKINTFLLSTFILHGCRY